MPYTLPTFNLTCNIWRTGLNPRVAPPTLSALCNLQMARKTQSVAPYNATTSPSAYGDVAFWMFLLLPKGTDIRPGWTSLPTPNDIQDAVEVPAGSGRFYWVGAVDDTSKGFAAEYRVALIIPYPPWPTPIP